MELSELEDALRSADLRAALRLCQQGGAPLLSARLASGNTLLHLAAEHDELAPLVAELVRAGISANAVNRNGATPLHRAARKGQRAVARQLVECGADPYLVDQRGQTAMALADEATQREMEAVLEGKVEGASGAGGRGSRLEGRRRGGERGGEEKGGEGGKQERRGKGGEAKGEEERRGEGSGEEAKGGEERGGEEEEAQAKTEGGGKAAARREGSGGGAAEGAEREGAVREGGGGGEVSAELVERVLRPVLLRLEAGGEGEREEARLLRLRAHLEALLEALLAAPLQWGGAAAAVAAAWVCDNRLHGGSDVAAFLEERLVAELRRVMASIRRVASNGGWGVTLYPVAEQLAALLPQVERGSDAEAFGFNCPQCGASLHTPLPKKKQTAVSCDECTHIFLVQRPPAARSGGAWGGAVRLFNSALVRQLLLAASALPPLLLQQADVLHAAYATLEAGGRAEGLHAAIEVLRRMPSKTKPLLLHVEWPAGEQLPRRLFYKEGDDLLQDVATSLLLHELNVAWDVGGAGFFTPVYGVYPLAHLAAAGFLECLPDAQPVGRVERLEYSAELHASCVGGMVASHVLGLADRHQDNMLLLGGKVFAHIDFGFVAGARPWPFDTGPFPIPMTFKRACADKWERFLDDCQLAYEMLQARREQICLVARTLATPLSTSEAPASSAEIGFDSFLEKTLSLPSSEIRKLAEQGPGNWSTRVKDATYSISGAMRDVGVL